MNATANKVPRQSSREASLETSYAARSDWWAARFTHDQALDRYRTDAPLQTVRTLVALLSGCRNERSSMRPQRAWPPCGPAGAHRSEALPQTEPTLTLGCLREGERMKNLPHSKLQVRSTRPSVTLANPQWRSRIAASHRGLLRDRRPFHTVTQRSAAPGASFGRYKVRGTTVDSTRMTAWIPRRVPDHKTTDHRWVAYTLRTHDRHRGDSLEAEELPSGVRDDATRSANSLRRSRDSFVHQNSALVARGSALWAHGRSEPRAVPLLRNSFG